MRLNLPNTLTLFRIFLVPILVVVLLTPPWAMAWVKAQVHGVEGLGWAGSLADGFAAWRELVAVVIFLIAALTDFLDGYLARSRDQVTTLGKLLDPIADKLLTVSAFISLVELNIAPAWMIVVIVGREFAVSGMRSFAASRGLVIAASGLGKLKTVSQVIAITLLIPTRPLARFEWFAELGTWMLWLVMLLAIVSMVDYFAKFIQQVDLGEER